MPIFSNVELNLFFHDELCNIPSDLNWSKDLCKKRVRNTRIHVLPRLRLIARHTKPPLLDIASNMYIWMPNIQLREMGLLCKCICLNFLFLKGLSNVFSNVFVGAKILL